MLCWIRNLRTVTRYSSYRCVSTIKSIGGDGCDDDKAFGDSIQQTVYRDLFNSLTKRWHLSDMEHSVFLIQPNYKYKMRTNFLTNVKFQTEESVALVKTLPKWQVVDTEVCTVKYRRGLFFGKGQLATLVNRINNLPENIKNRPRPTAVFISTNMLTSNQLTRLKGIFGVDVYDRYALVLEIFRRHAKTSEAKLQVALAEVPYVRARIGEIIRSKSLDQISGGLTSVCGPGETLTEQIKRFLHQREGHIVKQLKRVEEQRSMLRSCRQKREMPSIAVVGYTNAGKTSLIRCLSDDSAKLTPNSRLFATLDVTAHGSKLPCGLQVVYLDTVGFLSDLPHQLVAAFKSTLEDVTMADLIVHVMDISNPDWQNQRQQVLTTLETLRIPSHLVESMIHVGNKSDIIDFEKTHLEKLEVDCEIYKISTKSGQGLSDLVNAVENRLLTNTGRRVIRLRIPTAGAHLPWLHHEGALIATREASPDGESLVVDALFTEALHSRFRAKFGQPGR